MKNILTTIGIILAIVLGFAGYTKQAETPVVNNVGALSSPDIISPYLRWGGVASYAASQPMQTATTTLCWFENPSTGTSTIESVTFQVNTGTSTAANITIATSTTRYATSTNDTPLVANQAVLSGGTATHGFRSSTGRNFLLGPSEYVVVRTAGAGLNGYTFGGLCQATFHTVSN